MLSINIFEMAANFETFGNLCNSKLLSVRLFTNRARSLPPILSPFLPSPSLSPDSNTVTDRSLLSLSSHRTGFQQLVVAYPLMMISNHQWFEGAVEWVLVLAHWLYQIIVLYKGHHNNYGSDCMGTMVTKTYIKVTVPST